MKKKREREITTPRPPHLQALAKLVVPYLFSKEEPLSLVSISETIISCNTSLKGQIIGERMKTRIYTFISTEFLFSRHKIDLFAPDSRLKS